MKGFRLFSRCISAIIYMCITTGIFSQTGMTDSIRLQRGNTKLNHAEPLFNDLVRDLGARKGEQEWNVGFGMTGNENYLNYTGFVEFEFAPVNRLGIEIEFPFSFFSSQKPGAEHVPDHQLESIKIALQYTFLVSARHNISIAAGYMNELEPVSFSRYGKTNLFKGNIYRPFIVAAKNWNKGFHTLLMAGPVAEHNFSNGNVEFSCMVNANFHYMIPGSRSFAGLEMDNEFYPGEKTNITLRPQVRLALRHNLLIGIVAGVPVTGMEKQFSFFTRFIYEPVLKKNRKK